MGAEGKYEVSNLGRVRSLTREYTRADGQRQVNIGRMLRPGWSRKHYPTVVIGRGNTRTVHSLVAEAFLGPRPAGMEVRHINGNYGDARAANLKYGTRTENILDAVAAGTWASEKRKAAWATSAKKAWATRYARYGPTGRPC